MANALPALTPEALFALLRAVAGMAGRPDDEHPFIPGPSAPVIREAFDHVNFSGPHPEPWRLLLAAILSLRPELWEPADGGPGAPVHSPSLQRMAVMRAIGDGVVSRAQVVQDVASATDGKAEQRGIIIVSGYVNRMVDEFCGTGFRLKPPHVQPRDPHPPHPFDDVLSGVDLVILAMGLDRGARQAGSGPLRDALEEGAKKLLSKGAERAAR